MTDTPAPARYATARTPARPSYGAAIAKVSAAMGKPLQAWQRQVVDVATEVLPDGSWAYDTVVIHVQRQAGKTTLVGPVNLHRVLTKRCKCWLTAQSRQDARDTWLDVAELVKHSPLSDIMSDRLSNGSEALTSPLGSTFRVFAPSEDGLHGKANEAVTVDEVWAFDQLQGASLEQAIRPTFTTTGGQLWLTSTAGTARSTWFRSYVDRGRAAVAAGVTEGIAYFEWSVTPEQAEEIMQLLVEVKKAGDDAVEADPVLRAKLDRAMDLTMAAHPGEYAQRKAVRSSAKAMAPGEFLRAYGNHWTLTADSVIAEHEWQACRDLQLLQRKLDPPPAGALALAFDVTPDRKRAGIAGSWLVDGIEAVDVLDERAGDEWLVARIEQVATRWGVTQVAYDKAGPALDIADKLAQRGIVEPVGLSSADARAASAGMLAAIKARQLVHRGTAALDSAVANAAVKPLGDGGWVWSRKHSAGSIVGLTAATWARWGLHHKPEPAAVPVIATRRRDERPKSLTV